MQIQSRSARREITELEDKVLDLHIQANHEEGEQKAATLEQLEAATKTLELTRWSYDMAPPELNTGVKTT
jgi:hypothetical protein